MENNYGLSTEEILNMNHAKLALFLADKLPYMPPLAAYMEALDLKQEADEIKSIQTEVKES